MTESPAVGAVTMDTRAGRAAVAAPAHRLRGADRSGLGEKGWAETPADGIGHPDDTNVAPDYYEPQPLSGRRG